GNVYDFFRNRLMFPIRNIRGQVIAFSARTMIGEEPKYINTGDTPIFAKGSEVFGLYEARKSIQDKKRVIVVEGQMDVIQLSQAGFGEACAPLGTAIRAEHIERLLKMTDHVIFSFDGDAAGRKAAKRAMD
ncbi:MAG TPA: DNA primase, partial [Sutterellaceae bacterium]|nr:DNA primase [Sutterellaceae bacterium]